VWREGRGRERGGGVGGGQKGGGRWRVGRAGRPVGRWKVKEFLLQVAGG